MNKEKFKELGEKELEKVTGGVQVAQDGCNGCGMCVNTCPVKCIYREKRVYYIDQNQCIGCGSCAAVCPVHCIGG